MSLDKSRQHRAKPTIEGLDERIVPATLHPHVAAAGHVVALATAFPGPGNTYGVTGTGATSQVSRGFRSGAATAPRFIPPRAVMPIAPMTPSRSAFPGPGNNYGVMAGGGTYSVSRATPRFQGSSFGGRYSPYINVPAAVSPNPYTPATTASPSYAGFGSFLPSGTLPTYTATGVFFNGGSPVTITVPAGTAIDY